MPELGLLQRFVGSWEHYLINKPAEWTPEKTTRTLTAKSEWILDGRVLQGKAEWSPSGTKALSLMAYDAQNKEYRSWYFDSSGSMPRGENRGTGDEANKTFMWKGTLPNGVTSTQIHRFIDNDTQDWTLVFKDSTGKVLSNMEAKGKRKPSVTHSDAQRQEGKASPPEMKALEKLVGTWKVEQENKVPEQARLTYFLKGQSILGGRFVQQMGSSHDEVEPTQTGMYTYDPSKKSYRYWFFMSSGSFTDITGTWDESS